MKNFLLISCLFLALQLSAQDALNITLLDQFHRGDARYSGSWVYATEESEYALIGSKEGTAVYQIRPAGTVEEVGFIAGPSSNWREITVVGDYAYVTTEGNGVGAGMQIIALTSLPDSVTLVDTYSNTFTRAHIIQKDIFSEAPYVYVIGTTTTQGVHILDVSNPETPQEIGLYQPGYYIHDCLVSGDTLYAAAFYEGTMDVVDISDKTNPQLITRLFDPGGSTHSASITADKRYLFVANERDGIPGRIWDIQELDNFTEIATWTANLQSLVHNPYIRGNFAFISHNTEGLRILDIADPSFPVEVGYYDTFEGSSGGFNGLWSACPYLPSGRIIGGNREDGLYVWEFNNQAAGRIYGIVKDSLTDLPLSEVSIELMNSVEPVLTSDASGEFRLGRLPATLQVRFSKDNYLERIVEIDLQGGDALNWEIKLQPLSSSTNTVTESREISIQPNPFRTSTTVDLSNISDAASLQLYNPQGKMIRQEFIEGKSTIQINRENLSNGVYRLLIWDQRGNMLKQSSIILQ